MLLSFYSWLGDLFSNPVDRVFFLSILCVIVIIIILIICSKILSHAKAKKYYEDRTSEKGKELNSVESAQNVMQEKNT